VDAYVNRGGAHQAKHELDAAISDTTRPSKSKLTRPVLTTHAPPRNRQRRDLNGALADYSKTIQLDPKLSARYANRAVIEAQQGKNAEAVNDFAKASKSIPA